MSENNNAMVYIAIVAMVAIVALVVLIGGKSATNIVPIDLNDENIAGQRPSRPPATQSLSCGCFEFDDDGYAYKVGSCGSWTGGSCSSTCTGGGVCMAGYYHTG